LNAHLRMPCILMKHSVHCGKIDDAAMHAVLHVLHSFVTRCARVMTAAPLTVAGDAEAEPADAEPAETASSGGEDAGVRGTTSAACSSAKATGEVE
jgi:hypothetical protein